MCTCLHLQLQGLLYDGALLGEEGHEAMIMNGHVYRNEAAGAEVTTSSCYAPDRCGAQLTDGGFYFNVSGPKHARLLLKESRSHSLLRWLLV